VHHDGLLYVRRALLALIVSGCGARTELSTPHPAGSCGDAVVDPGEQCDLGAGNSDAPGSFVVSQGSTAFEVTPLVRAKSSVAFYDYVGASSFTGLEVQSESRLYLYMDSTTGNLSLIVNHNIFGQGNGSANVTFDGLPSGFSVALSDDPKELRSTGSSSARGAWNWSSNTDGGVITGLTCPGEWSIQVSADFKSGISAWNWVNADASRTPLAIGHVVTIQSVKRCRTDCTIPACGQ
jgi:hypothetical protein